MKFFTRIPFTFWVVTFFVALITKPLITLGSAPLLYVLALYWGFTFIILGLATLG